MIDLCKLFGVEDGEEFKIEKFPFNTNRYKVYEGVLQFKTEYDEFWRVSNFEVNSIAGCEIIKLPKKKEFTDDELAIMRGLPKSFKWIARDDSGEVFIYQDKPIKQNKSGVWSDNGAFYNSLHMFTHLFNSIQWEDEEPVFIDDYVER